MRDPLLERLRDATRGEYEVVRLLGRGRLAAVYLAHDIGLDLPVALKVLRPDHARSHATSQRFLHEAGAAAGLAGNPHTVRVYQAPERDGLRFLVMQYVDGCTLERLLRDAPPPMALACHVLAHVALALRHAHDRGSVHGDVEPGNIMLDRSGAVVVTDFGIGAVAGRVRATTVGTPEYTSPEQWLGAEPTAPSDQYALGAIAYEAITGAPPFTGAPAELRRAHLELEPPPLCDANPDCPAPLATVVHRMLAKNPDDRWPTLESAHAAFVAAARDGDTESTTTPAAQLGALVAEAAARETALTFPLPVAEPARAPLDLPPVDETPIERLRVVSTRVPRSALGHPVLRAALASVAVFAILVLVRFARDRRDAARAPVAVAPSPESPSTDMTSVEPSVASVATPTTPVATPRGPRIAATPRVREVATMHAAPAHRPRVRATRGTAPDVPRDVPRDARRVDVPRHVRSVVAGDVAVPLDSAAPNERATDARIAVRAAARRAVQAFVADLESRRVDALARRLATDADPDARAFLAWLRTAPRLEVSPVVIHAPTTDAAGRAGTDVGVWLHWRSRIGGASIRRDAEARFRVELASDDGMWHPIAMRLAERFPFAPVTTRYARRR